MRKGWTRHFRAFVALCVVVCLGSFEHINSSQQVWVYRGFASSVNTVGSLSIRVYAWFKPGFGKTGCVNMRAYFLRQANSRLQVTSQLAMVKVIIVLAFQKPFAPMPTVYRAFSQLTMFTKN